MKYYFRNGNIPIIILSLHNGNNDLSGPIRNNDKNISNFVNKNDLYTAEISRNIFNNMKKKKIKPYLLINNIDRKFIDLNRPINDACSSKDCQKYYYLFHKKLSDTIINIKNIYGKCLVFDIHGNKHSKNMIQLGYNISLSNLKNNNFNNHSFNSLKTKSNKELKKFIYKEKSISFYLQNLTKLFDISIYPSENNLKNTIFDGKKNKYYAGLKTIMMKYRNICDVIQVEMSIDVRENKLIPEEVANLLIKYYKNVYK